MNETMNGNEKIALFDMDNTLCDFQGQIIEDLNRLRGPDEPEVANLDNLPEYLEERMSVIKIVPGWWRNLPRLQDGFRLLSAAIEIGFIPHILTKGPVRTVSAWTEKVEWCRSYIDQLGYTKQPIDITITQRKGLVYGTVLVDDWPPYIEQWLKWRRRGLVVMPARDYNAGFRHPQVIRYNDDNFEEVVEQMRKAYLR